MHPSRLTHDPSWETPHATCQPEDVLTGEKSWMKVGLVSDFPPNGGATVLHGKSQIAVYNIARRNVSQTDTDFR